MGADRSRSDHLQAELCRKHASFLVQVVKHLHMIGQKANWMDQDGARPAGTLFSEVLYNVRLEPRIAGTTALTLVDQGPALLRNTELLGYQTTRRG
jgi:hypothetical protein